MLFRRYSDIPFLLHSIKFEKFSEFLSFMVQQQNDDELWEVWKSNPFKEGSFEDFKNGVVKEAQRRSKTKDEVELEAKDAANKALSSLNKYGSETLGS